MRAPLTALVFAIELTGRFGLALPILTAGVVAHTFTVLVLKRSILTEKVARRGYTSAASTRSTRWRSCSSAR
jgi:CIC family chloride channel protein